MLFKLLKPILFAMDPEKAHRLTIRLLSKFYSGSKAVSLAAQAKQQPLECFGVKFKNPLGVAAGFDKDGECLDALFALGFGFVEVGTVTPRQQPGNPKPRLLRFAKEQAVINRMGFNNAGVAALKQRLEQREVEGTLGINIGKNKGTPLEKAYEDYAYCMRELYSYADFFVVNISSPNTIGLRDLQHGDYLTQLLAHLKELQQQLSEQHNCYKPLVVKLAPDLSDAELQQSVEIILTTQMDGICATNTSIDHSPLAHCLKQKEAGGLSGRLIADLSRNIVAKIRTQVGPDFPIIGVGGIDSRASAEKMQAAGANLIEVYTGLVFKGPGLVSELMK